MIPELEQLGFTRNEANVYFTSLKLGASSVLQLARATGLNRVTVHSIAEKFEAQGLFMHLYQGKKRKLVAVDPERLDVKFREQERAIESRRQALHRILPGLCELFRRQDRGLQIRTFQGEKGYEQMCEDVLETKAPMLEYANIDLLNKVIGKYIAADFLPRKHILGIPTKFLLVDSPASRKYIQTNYMHTQAAPMEAKFVKKAVFPTDALIIIYGHKISILAPKTMDGVIIEDQSVADALRPFFYFAWAQAGDGIRNN